MGICIPNMEKPTSCNKCPFTCEKLAFFDGENRPKGCPLIEIPTPHGRLIDADKVFCYDFMDEQNIDNAPTIIEEEE